MAFAFTVAPRWITPRRYIRTSSTTVAADQLKRRRLRWHMNCLINQLELLVPRPVDGEVVFIAWDKVASCRGKSFMSTSSGEDGDAHVVEVSLLKFKPLILIVSAVCLVGLVALLSWMGRATTGQGLASKTVGNHAANQDSGERQTIPNSATSLNVQPARAGAVTATDEPTERDDASAEAAAEDEESAAPSVAITSTDSATAPVPVSAAGATGVGYAVQIGSFNTVSEANERVSRLRAAGFEARTAAVELEKQRTWYRVYSGHFASREAAKLHDKKLRAARAVGETIITATQD